MMDGELVDLVAALVGQGDRDQALELARKRVKVGEPVAAIMLAAEHRATRNRLQQIHRDEAPQREHDIYRRAHAEATAPDEPQTSEPKYPPASDVVQIYAYVVDSGEALSTWMELSDGRLFAVKFGLDFVRQKSERMRTPISNAATLLERDMDDPDFDYDLDDTLEGTDVAKVLCYLTPDDRVSIWQELANGRRYAAAWPIDSMLALSGEMHTPMPSCATALLRHTSDE